MGTGRGISMITVLKTNLFRVLLTLLITTHAPPSKPASRTEIACFYIL